ncbi:uncharacterized protein RJT20DRAFT_93631 [Scheffersomyces xylosifermentans]|uniref:uncharacterized protein n=1 Tax=Scheffersomyces xylosifermentans TaxID=1304137 RepID=UPI00315DE7AA
MCYCISDFILIVLSVLFPPLPVWIRRGFCTSDSLINILLCMLGYFPGLIHSWYIIAKYPPYSSSTKVYYVYRNDLENQTPRPNDSHIHIHHHEQQPRQQPQKPITQQPLFESHPQPNYGAITEGSSSNNNAPPAYTEYDNKTQH